MNCNTRKFQCFFVISVTALVACAGRPKTRINLPPPAASTTRGAGDYFIFTIVGEDKLPQDFRVAPDGTVDLPDIRRVQVAGLEPQEVVDLVRKKLIEADVLRDPSVAIDVREYNSKRVV